MNPQPANPKKRTRNENQWRSNVHKRANVHGLGRLNTQGNWQAARQLPTPQEEACACHPACSGKITAQEKAQIFTQYYDLGSHTEQNVYLRGCILDGAPRRQKYVAQINGRSEFLCQKYFLALHAIAKSRLRTKVLNKSVNPADLRGKHGNHRKTPQHVLADIRQYLRDLNGRESHYSRANNRTKTYLDSHVTISSLHRDFKKVHPEYDSTSAQFTGPEVIYKLFEKIFNYEFNLAFGFPRSDICETCEQLHVKILAAEAQVPPDQEELDSLYLQQQEHWLEADGFVNSMKRDVLSILPANELCITFDYEKNLPLPVTNIAAEYFLSQLWLFNFCIHNLRNDNASMYVYAEHFARKSSNEVISCLNHYIRTEIPAQVEVLRIWADNSFGQNKNRYVLAYLKSLQGTRFREVRLSFPVPGHSRTRCDKNFALIEKQKKKRDKFSFPSDWTRLITSAKSNPPFTIVYVEHNLNDDLSLDGTPIVNVMNYKDALNPLLRPPAQLNEKRIFHFAGGRIRSTNSTIGTLFTEYDLLRASVTNQNLLDAIQNAPRAYPGPGYLEISTVKKANIKKLLNSVMIPPQSTFYESLNLNADDDDDDDLASNLTNISLDS